LRGYAGATEHQKIAFEVLKQKDEKSSREIEAQLKKLQKLQVAAGCRSGDAPVCPLPLLTFSCPQELVAATKGQLAAHLRESEEQNRRVREEKERELRRLQELKSEMSRVRARARGCLARLTAQSGAALTALGRVVEKAQRVLRLAEMCRRLETEEEKVLPFYPSSLAPEEQRDTRQILQEPPAEPLAGVRSQRRGPKRCRGEGRDPGAGMA
ncbi:DRC2 protein, partial [Pterocles burchelli]|nr:DRC2 protein [Pterocles burchelli]